MRAGIIWLISTPWLNPLPGLHLGPINRLILPEPRQLVHQRLVQRGPLVLSPTPLKPPAPAADRDRPVSRRSEPSSRTPLMAEQANPWELLHPQDGMSRHRGAEQGR